MTFDLDRAKEYLIGMQHIEADLNAHAVFPTPLKPNRSVGFHTPLGWYLFDTGRIFSKVSY